MSALDDLARMAAQTQGHVTLHASYGPEAERHPDPDWACQLIYTGTARFADGDREHVFNWYATGPTLDAAVLGVLDQINQAILAAQQAAASEETDA